MGVHFSEAVKEHHEKFRWVFFRELPFERKSVGHVENRLVTKYYKEKSTTVIKKYVMPPISPF